MENARNESSTYLDAPRTPRILAALAAIAVSATILGGTLALFDTQANATAVASIDAASGSRSIAA